MVRSSSALLSLAALGGCDVVAGLDGDATPCDVPSFAEATTTDVVEAEEFSFDWYETFGVVQVAGLQYEMSPTDATLTPIDIGPYMAQGLSLTPEGDAVFFTILIEPLTLKGALRGDTTNWRLDARVPRGTFAGTPSADVFGPRRVLVRMRAGDEEPIQEYEDQAGVWNPVGPPRVMRTPRAPNLTPDGLTMVYPGFDEVGEPAVFVQQRPSTTAEFGDAKAILPGAFTNAQLLARCQKLYTSDALMLRRYE